MSHPIYTHEQALEIAQIAVARHAALMDEVLVSVKHLSRHTKLGEDKINRMLDNVGEWKGFNKNRDLAVVEEGCKTKKVKLFAFIARVKEFELRSK